MRRDQYDRARRLLARQDRDHPDLVALATAVSLAVRVEPGLLRRARLELVPGVGVAVEPALWFSDLVRSSSPRGLVLERTIAILLRERLAQDPARLDAAHALTGELHRDSAPTLRLEENLLHAGLCGDTERIRNLLDVALRTLADEPDRASGIARWVDRALPAAPAVVREDPRAQRLAAAAALSLGVPMVVGLRLTRRGIEISEPPVEGAAHLDLPAASPQVTLHPLSAVGVVEEAARTLDVTSGRIVRHRWRHGGAGVEVGTSDGRITRLTPIRRNSRVDRSDSPRRLIVCCDGRWDSARTPGLTNVVKFATAVANNGEGGMDQSVYYDPGVGTRSFELLRGLRGTGVSWSLRDAYGWLVATYRPGDQICIFGASRGALVARSLGGLIQSSGILRSEHTERIDEALTIYRSRNYNDWPYGERAVSFRQSWSHETRISVVGVWETVGALGVPDLIPGARGYRLHDTRPSPVADAYYQALALDERRSAFAPALWTGSPNTSEQIVRQVWFAGVHGDVVGGSETTGLSDVPLLWMIDRAREHGVVFDDKSLAQTAPDPLAPMQESVQGVYRFLRESDRRIGGDGVALAATVRQRMAAALEPPYLPASLFGYEGPIDEVPTARNVPGF